MPKAVGLRSHAPSTEWISRKEAKRQYGYLSNPDGTRKSSKNSMGILFAMIVPW